MCVNGQVFGACELLLSPRGVGKNKVLMFLKIILSVGPSDFPKSQNVGVEKCISV